MSGIADQTWLAQRYAENAAFVPALGVPVLERKRRLIPTLRRMAAI